MKIFKTILLFLSCCIFSVHAFETEVATIQKVIGAARVKMRSTGTVKDLQENQTVDEGDLIQTSDHSMVKLKFIDDTQVIISSSTQFFINSYPKNDAGVFAVLRGQIRSIVSKKIPANVEKDKIKLYLRTKTAVMGIRGTDFQLNYNSEDQNTSLITFHGKVVMNALDQNSFKITRQRMEEVLNRRDAVFIEDGHASVVDRSFSRKIMKPVRINEDQFRTLKMNNSHLLDHFKEEHKDEGKKEANNNSGTIKSIGERGYLDKSTGEYKAPDGSFLDLERSTIIPAFKAEHPDINKESGRINLQREKMEAAKEKFRSSEVKQIKEERPAIRERMETRPEKPEPRRERPEREKPAREKPAREKPQRHRREEPRIPPRIKK